MSFILSRRELLKMGAALPWIPRGGNAMPLLEDSANLGFTIAPGAQEVLVPIPLTGVPGMRSPSGDLLIRPGETLRFTAQAPENLDDMAWLLRLIGQVDFDPVVRSPYLFQLFLYLIDDALDAETTHHQAYSLLFEGMGEPRTQAAYMRVLWDFGARPGNYPLAIWVKKEAVEILSGGRVGVEVALYRKRPARRIDDISGPPDATYFLDVAGGTSDWHRAQLPVPMDDGVACALFKIVAEKYRGKVWFEDPWFAGNTGDSGASEAEAIEPGIGVTSLPPFAPANPFQPYRTWLGVNLSKKEWPQFRITINGREAYSGLVFQPEYPAPRSEIEIPKGILRPGSNDLSIELERNPRDQHGYLLRRAQWLGTPGARLEVVACPPLVVAGKDFSVLVRTREANLQVAAEVSPDGPSAPGNIAPLNSNSTLREPGLHFVKFHATEAGQGANLRFHFDNQEQTAAVERVVERPEDNVLVGSGDSQWSAYHKDSLQRFFAWHFGNGVGNYILFRPIYYDGAGTRFYDPDAWRYAVRMCTEAEIHYSFLQNQAELPELDSNPTADVIDSPLYLGSQEHELDGSFYYWSRQFNDPLRVYQGDLKNAFRLPELALHVDLFDRDPRRSRCPNPSDPRLATDTMLRYRWCSQHAARDMREGAEYFIENVRKVIPGGPRHCGPATLFKYFFQAGTYKYQIGEMMYGPFDVVLAALRGASWSHGQPHYGSHIASQWSTTPHDDPAAFRRYFLALATCYLHGVREIYQEDCLSIIEYKVSEVQDRFSASCQGHLKVHQAFYRFTRAHSRRGQIRVPVGFLHGQYDAWNCCNNPAMIWGQAGPEWNAGPPEQSWDLLKVFFPRSVLGLIYRNPCPHESVGYYTGTPYGPANIVPIESEAKHLGQYRSLALLGWNTADAAQIDRLVDYVENGGHLILGLVHLSTEVRRNLPPQPIASSGVRKLLGLEIRGLKASAGNYAGKETKDDALAKLVGMEALQLGDVELHEAVARVTDRQGTPLLLERGLGRGRVTFLNAAAYPGEAGVVRLYAELLRSAGEASLAEQRQKVWVKGNEDVSFSVWDWDASAASATSTIYLLNINWWADNPEPAEATLLWKDTEIPLSITREKIHVITVTRHWGIWVDDGETDVMAIEGDLKRAKITLQGQGKTALKILYRPLGGPSRLRARRGGEPAKLEPLSTKGLWQMELVLNGPAQLDFEMS